MRSSLSQHSCLLSSCSAQLSSSSWRSRGSHAASNKLFRINMYQLIPSSLFAASRSTQRVSATSVSLGGHDVLVLFGHNLFFCDKTMRECAICMDQSSPETKTWWTMTCKGKHSFHARCIGGWYVQSRIDRSWSHMECPLCKQPTYLPEPNDDSRVNYRALGFTTIPSDRTVRALCELEDHPFKLNLDWDTIAQTGEPLRTVMIEAAMADRHRLVTHAEGFYDIAPPQATRQTIYVWTSCEKYTFICIVFSVIAVLALCSRPVVCHIRIFSRLLSRTVSKHVFEYCSCH